MGRQADVEHALYERITEDAQAATLIPGGYWRAMAPRDAPYPFLTFLKVNAVPDYSLADLGSVTYTYRFTAWVEGESAEPAEAILDWLYGLLQDQPLDLPGGRENDLIRWSQSPSDTMLADDAGATYQTQVAEYVIVVQEA